MFFFVVLATTTIAQSAPPLSAIELESSLQVREHQGERFATEATMLVELRNTSDSPLDVSFQALTVRNDAGAALAECTYLRGTVWTSNGVRDANSAFQAPLVPGERVRIKLFYQWPAEVPAPSSYLRFTTSFAAAGQVVTVHGSRIRPAVLRAEVDAIPPAK
jgi:hypothetical protein